MSVMSTHLGMFLKETNISTTSNIMIEEHDTIKFLYNITICLHNVIPTASNIMKPTTFAYDIAICIHTIIPPASNMMIKSHNKM